MPDPVAIFWDYSSCLNSDTGDESNIALLLRKECAQHGNITSFKTYFGLSGTSPSTDIRSEIEEMGITTVDRPKAGFGAFATDVLCFLFDHHDMLESTTVVLVSCDPGIAYLVYALHTRRARVGLITSSRLLKRLSPRASWTEDWENFASTIKSTSDHGQVKAETTEAPQVPSPTAATPRPTKIKYKVTGIHVPRPLTPPNDQAAEMELGTTTHRLGLREDNPIYATLIKDPEAIKIKIWRRRLTYMYFHQSIGANPQVTSELDTIFTSLEQYDKMSWIYLAFSRIGKLFTQISQKYLGEFDYRHTYKARAKELLIKWEPLNHPPEEA